MEHLHNIVSNSLKILIARGYNINPYKDRLEMETEEFEEYLKALLGGGSNYSMTEYRRACNMECNHTKDRSKKILVFFATRERGEKFVNSKNISEVVVGYKRYNEIIIVTNANFAPQAKDRLEAVSVNVNLFYDSELTYCVTERIEYSPHVALTEEEMEQFLKDNNVKRSQLPQMLTSDIVCKWFNFQPDSIVRIDRNDYGVSVLTPHTTNYRLVVRRGR